MTNRLNARLDDDLAMKLDQLCQQTNKSITEVVRASIELYYERFQEKLRSSAQGFDESGFIGCGDGEDDLSSTYKTDLGESLSQKTGA